MFRYPIPFGGIANTVFGLLAMTVSINSNPLLSISHQIGLWFQFPASWRKIYSFRKRAFFAILCHLLHILFCLFYWFYWWMFTVVNEEYLQFILVSGLPFFRFLLTKLLSKLGE